MLHQRWCLPVVLQCRHTILIPECQGEVGARDPTALSTYPHPASGHPGRPPAGCQHSHSAGQVQRASSGATRGVHVCWRGACRVIYGVFSTYPEEPERGVWCSDSSQHSEHRQPAAEADETHAQKDEDTL